MDRSDFWRAAIAAPSENAAQTFWAMVQTVRDRERRIREIRGNTAQPAPPPATERSARLTALRSRPKARRGSRYWRDL